MKPFLRIIKFAKNFLAQLAIISLVLEQFIFVSTAAAQTLPITPDGSTNTQVTQTASGVDQINIAAPGANGTSHNKFENYNVNAGGQVINNFSGKNSAEIAAGSGATAVTQTQIGGLVTANSNLASSGSAKVILNEVTSGNTSQLLGYTEIAGTKADFILANPNGIACHGCGFINTARLLMVAGSSNFDANGNLGFNLKEQANPNLYVPLITIDGLGLDFTRTSGTEIVASSVKLLSSIFGSDSNSVAIRTGEGRYDYATKTITGNNTQNNTDPVFAIDASALAQIQAGQVYIIATKQGVGVKMESEILASQTLNLDANGDIYYKSISVGDTANLRSSGTIQTTDSNSSISAPTINITANQFNNSGLASAYNLNIQNSGTLNNSGNLEALNLNLANITNINNSGSIFGQNSLSISGTNLTNNSSGSIYSPVDYKIALTGLLTNSGLITSANNLTLNSNQFSNSGEVSAQNNLTLSVANSANNSGNLIAGNALNFTANSLTNSGATQSGGSSTLNVSSLTNQKDATVYSKEFLSLNITNTLKNSGKISAAKDLSITGNSTISNYSKILSSGDLTISANSLRSGSYGMVSLLDGISVDINSPDFGKNSDAVVSSLTKSLNLSLATNLQNFGELSSSDALTISSPNFANFGNIIGNKTLNLSASFNLFNSGNIQSSEDTTINTASLYNSGLINSLQSATINADEISNQADGVISTTNDLALTSTSLSSLGLISSGNNFTADSSSLTNSGSIYSANNFSITNSSDLTNSGTFYSDGSLAILSNSITNNSSAWIYGSKDISLNSNLDLTNAGNIQATTDLTLLVGRNSNNSGTIVGNQLTFTNSGSLTNSGSVASENDIILSATNFTNSGLLQSIRDTQINLSGSFDNQDGSTIYSGRNFSSTSSSSFSNSGEISSVNSATISASSLTNQGTLLADSNLTINATSITNSEEATLASINQALTINISDYLENSGTIFAKTNFTLANLTNGTQLNSVTNDGDISFNSLVGGLRLKNFSNSGNFVSGQDLTITSSNSFNNSGTLNSLSDLNINATSLTNSGAVQSSGSSTFNLLSLTNSANSSIYSDRALNLNLVESLNNSGSISSQGNLVITGNSAITNSNKILSNSDLNISAESLSNSSDSLIASLAKSLTLSLVGDLRNEGDLGAITNIGVTSTNFSNSGNIIAGSTSIIDGSIISLGNLAVNASGSFNNSGNLQSTKDTSINSASSLSNSGLIKSLGKATINTSSFDNQLSSAIASNGDLSIITNSFSNLGAISTGNNFVANSSSFTNSGSIYSANNFSITNISDLTNSGTFYSDGSLAILSNNITNNNSAWIYGSKDISLTSNLNLTNSGNIQAAANLNLLIGRNTDNSGVIIGDQIIFNNAGDITNSGSIGSQNDINLSAANLTNSGLIKNLGNSNFALSGNLTNQSGAAISVGRNFALNSNGALNNSGEISAVNSATISSSSFTNKGSVLANNDLTIRTSSVSNSSDATLASINQALTLNISDYLDNSGTIFAKTNFTLANLATDAQLNSVTNSGAIYFNKLSNSNSNLKVKNFSNSGNFASSSASDDLTVTSTNSFTNQGNLSSGKNLSISTQTAFNNSGTVLATQNLALATDSISNSGEISALRNLAIVSSGNISNSNKILSGGLLSVSTNSLSNNSSSAIASLSNGVNLAVVNDFTNNGQVSSANDLSITAKNFTDSGDVLAGAKLNAVVTNQITNSGNFQSLSDSIVTSSALDNSGSIKSFGTSAITANQVTNQTNAVIYSNLDASIVSATSITNRGSILSDSKLTINSGSNTNSGEIFANSDLVLSLTNTLTNSGSLSSFGNLTINSNSAITNSNQILSNGDLRIAATNLTNSSSIQSNGNITLSLSSLTNSQNISSSKDLSIVSAASVSNSGTLQSAGAFSINTNNFTNSFNSLILAGGNLNIRASSVSNQNTKPSNSNITSGIVSANGAVNIFADTLNNNSGIIAGKSTSVFALNNSSVNLYNTLGAFISTASVSLNLGNLDYTITGTVTASNIDITANNITNQGNVTASDFINLNATGNSGVVGSGNITNGFASGDNSNVQLAAGTYVNLVAKNNINNYGAILGTTDTTLTATNGSVNNYSTGEITGGSGTTTVNAANGSFNNTNQTSVFTANNNAAFNVKDLNNTGAISVANDLTTNVTNNLTNNPTALIWSGHDIIFNVANTFLNNQADIYADRNLTIQKNSSTDASQNKTNLVQNISGNIETYSGDINIKAVTLENKRSSMKSQGADYVYGQAYVTGGDCHRSRLGKLKCNPTIYRDLHAANILGAAGLEASIFSGNGITINSNSLLNDASSMISSSNFGINTSIFNNNSYTFVQYDDASRSYEYYNAYIKSGGALTITQNGASNPSLINGSNVVQYTASSGNAKQSQNTSINHIDSYQLSQTGALAVDLSSIINAINNSSNSKNAAALNVANAQVGSINTAISNHQIIKADVAAPTSSKSSNLSIKTSELSNPDNNSSQTGSLNKTISSQKVAKSDVAAPTSGSDISTPTASTVSVEATGLTSSNANVTFSGNFKINLDEAATTPLVESRSQFTDASKFFGSSYYFDQLGLTGSSVLADLDRQTRVNNIRMLGDSFTETKLIMDQLKNLTNDSLFLSKNTTDHNQQIKELLDNSVNQFAALGLNAEDVAIKGLTSDQTNSLTKDIVTFELTTVNGISVLAPKIYLSQDTRNRLFNSNSLTGGKALASSSTLFGQSGLTIDSPTASLTNNGSIVSGANLALNIGSLTNKTNSLSQAQIVAANNLSITANNGDIKNIGANIGSLGALNITALNGSILNTAIVQTNDKNLLAQNSDSYQLKLGDSARSSGNITSTLLQNASIKGGSVSINAANDFTNLAANISTSKNTLADGSSTSGNLNITAGNDINIGTLELRNRTETRWGSGRRSGISISDNTSNLSSSIDSSGSLNLFANGNDLQTSDKLQGSNIQITGSNLRSGGDLAITSNSTLPNISGVNFKNSILDSGGAISIASNNNISIANDKGFAVSSLALAPSLFSISSSSIKDDAAAARSGLSFNAASDIQLTSSGSINVANNYFNTGGSIFMTASQDINNSNYTIKASDNVVMSAGNDINNIHTTANNNETRIEAGNIVSLDAGHDINNVGATIKGGSLVYLTAGNDINNKALVNYTINGSSTNSDGSTITESQALASNARYIGSNLVSQGSIESSGNLVMVAANDINIKGSNVNSTGGSYVEATNGNINVTTAALRDKTFAEGGKRKKHWVSITDNVTNIESNVTSGGTLDLVASGITAAVSALPSEIGNINITGSKLTSADNLTLTAKNDINITSAQDTTYSYGAGRTGKGKSYSRQSNSTTQVESELATTNNGDISITSGAGNTDTVGSANANGSIALIASKLTTKDADSDASNNTGTGSIVLTAKEDLTISSALNTKYSESHSSKKGLTVKKSSTEINSSSTNVSSELNATGDITTNSGNDTNIIASNLSGSGSGSITSGGNTNIFNGVDTSYSYSESTKTRTGLLRQLPVYGEVISVLSTVYSPYLSLANGLTGGNLEKIEQVGGINYSKSNLGNSSTTEKLVASNLDFSNNLTIGSSADLTVKASNLKTNSGDITLAANGDVNILSAAQTSTTNRNYHDKSDRAKERGNTDTTEIKNISSTITSGSDLTIASGNDTTIQSSKLSSGDNLTIDAGNNLILATAKDSAIKSDESKGGTAYTFTNGTSGYVDVKAVNNEITSNTNSATINSNLDLNANNSILAQYRAGTMENVLSGANSDNQNLAYLKTVNDLAQADPNKIILDPIADTMKHWDQTTRGLTGAGQAVVAVAAIAVTVVTMGSGATLGAAMLTAAAASGAATASVAATNASMNTDSSLLGSTKSIASNTWKATTSEESIQNMAIAAVTAGAAFEASVYLSSTSSAAGAGSSAGSAAGSEAGAASNTTTAANTTVYVNPGLSNTTVLTSNAANNSSFFTNLGNATVKIGAATSANILATSAIKGQSINEVIADQGGAGKVILNTALQIVGEAGAMQIGNAAHTGQITQGQQIALHAALGCGIGAGMSGGRSGCAAGAAAGVVGELTSNAMYQEGNGSYNRNTSIAMGGLSGSLASAFTSIALGDDDSKVAKNIYAGNFIGTNAAANNSTLVDKDKKIIGYKDDKDDSIYQVGEDGKVRRIAYSSGLQEFENFDAPEYKTNGESPSITDHKMNVIGYSNELNSRYDLDTLVDGVRNNADFDLKTKFMDLGYTNTHLDGIAIGEKNGLPVISSAKTIGDFNAGRTIAYESLGQNLNQIGAAGFSNPNFNLPIVGSLEVNGSSFASLVTKVGSGIYNTQQNGFENPLYFGENSYSGRAINAGIDSLRTNPMQYIPNYSSSNGGVNSILNPSANQQNISTIPVITRDDVLKQYLR